MFQIILIFSPYPYNLRILKTEIIHMTSASHVKWMAVKEQRAYQDLKAQKHIDDKRQHQNMLK
jgi:hypothetical protein